MQVACETRRSYVKSPGRVKMEQFRLKFGTKNTKPLSKEAAAQASKARWLGLMTAPVKTVSSNTNNGN